MGLFINGVDASLRVDSNAFISIKGDFQNQKCDPVMQVRFSGGLILEGSLINNDSLVFFPSSTATSGRAKLTFTNSSSYFPSGTPGIAGNVRPTFWQLDCDRGMGAALILNTDIVCLDTLTFSSGFFHINNRKVFLKEPVGVPSVLYHPYLKNERQGAQFYPSSTIDTGLVIYQAIFPSTLNMDPANMGIEINGAVDVGSPITIKRGFRAQVYAGKSSILKYFDIHSPGHSLINNTVKIKYTLNDMSYYGSGYFAPSALRLFVSPLQDMNWSQLPTFPPSTLVLTNGPYNGILNATLSDLRHPHVALDSNHFRITIADPNCLNPPLSALTKDTLHVCAGQTVTLDAGNQTSIPNTTLRYTWQKNGSPATTHLRTLTVTPTTSFQKYNLLLSDVRGCLTRDSIVIAPAAPYPTIRYINHLNSCIGDSIVIKDTIQIATGTYSNTWNFSDNTTYSGNSQIFRKFFAGSGNHVAQLTSTSDHGCTTVSTLSNIVVYPNPTASFTTMFDCQTSIMHFTNLSVSNHSALVMVSQNWDFGLGQGYSSGGPVVSKTYSASGVYSVQVRVSSSFGCTDSLTLPVQVHPRNSSSFTKNNVCLNDTVYLNATGSCLTGSCNYVWFVDNQSPQHGVSLRQTFNTAGPHLVKLKVLAPLGCPDSSSSLVSVNVLPTSLFSASSTSICSSGSLVLQNTSSITAGAITSYTWSYGNNTTSTSTNAVTTYSQAGIYQISLTAKSDSGCVSSSSTNITVHPRPLSNYTVNDVCEQDPSLFVSSSSGTNYTYYWEFGNFMNSGTMTATTYSYTYPIPGVYNTTLTVKNQWGCAATSTLPVTIFPKPNAGLGSLVKTCGTSYTFNANNPGSNFLWYPGGASTSTLNATRSDSYQVQITSTAGCVSTESVLLVLNSIVTPNLGADTTVCGGIKLNAGYPGALYNWSNGSNSQFMNATTNGKYSVVVTDQNNCSGSDTIDVLVKPLPALDLGPDVQACHNLKGQKITANTNSDQITWSTGSTDTIILVSHSGLVWATATSKNGCRATDSIHISILPAPDPDLGADRSSCGMLTLDVMLPGHAVNWSSGDTTQTITLENSGLYFVEVTDPVNNCKGSDSINVVIFPKVLVKLPADTNICDNQELILDAKNQGAQFSWTNGDTTQTTKVTHPGYYAVTVTNAGGCSYSDQIFVDIQKAPVIDLGEQIKYVCGDKPLFINSSSAGSHQWSSNVGFNSTNKNIQLSLEGEYSLQVTQNGCTSTKTFTVVASNNLITASFLASTQDTINKPVQFINLTEPKPLSQTWFFGDGTTSSDVHPLHTYVSPKDYSVTLEVNNGYCSDRITKSLHAIFRSMKREALQSNFEITHLTVFPNPAGSRCYYSFELSAVAEVSLSVFDLSGKTVLSKEMNVQKDQGEIPLQNWAQGLYVIRLTVNGPYGSLVRHSKLIKTE